MDCRETVIRMHYAGSMKLLRINLINKKDIRIDGMINLKRYSQSKRKI